MIESHRAPSSLNLREFVKTSVILTPGALLVGCEPQFVLHFREIRRMRRIRRSGGCGEVLKNRVLNNKNRYLRVRVI